MSWEDLPSKTSTMLKKARDSEDFPLPVLPQMPTWDKRTARKHLTQPDIFRLLLYKHAQGCSPKLHKLVRTVTVPMPQQEAICAVVLMCWEPGNLLKTS